MKYDKDSSGNSFLQVPLGWNSPESKVRVSFIQNTRYVRLNKSDAANHIYPGPEVDIINIPRLIEALAKIYNDHIDEKN